MTKLQSAMIVMSALLAGGAVGLVSCTSDDAAAPGGGDSGSVDSTVSTDTGTADTGTPSPDTGSGQDSGAPDTSPGGDTGTVMDDASCQGIVPLNGCGAIPFPEAGVAVAIQGNCKGVGAQCTMGGGECKKVGPNAVCDLDTLPFGFGGCYLEWSTGAFNGACLMPDGGPPPANDPNAACGTDALCCNAYGVLGASFCASAVCVVGAQIQAYCPGFLQFGIDAGELTPDGAIIQPGASDAGAD